MPKKPIMIYQFKISLEGIKPPIWRRIQVPESYSFWDLHVAIQDAMGWLDCHLHEFEIINPKDGEVQQIGLPNEEWEFESILAGWETPINKYFSLTNTKAIYEYDFGDDWRHKILLEKILPATPLIKYPLCITGRRACPPEDCGGPLGYQNLLQSVNNPGCKEYADMMEWLDGEFNPELFSAGEVKFEDPKERLENSY